jgi:hypothetical protein
MSKDKNKDLNNDSVGPAMAGFGISPIFNQPRLLPAFNEARMQQKMHFLQ